MNARNELLSFLREEAPALSLALIASIYADPFWHERFGDRGRKHSNADGGYHASYLVEAIEAKDARLFVKYASWLRDVLVSRGMCTWHLVNNFERLGNVLRSRGPDGIEEAVAVLAAANAALTTPRTGDAQRVTDLRASTLRDLDLKLRELFPSRFDNGPPHWSVDARLYLEYAWDAADCGSPDVVPRHLAAVQIVEVKNGLGATVTGLVASSLAALMAPTSS